MAKISFDEEDVKAGAKGVAKAEDVIVAIPAVFGALQPEFKSAFQVVRIAVTEYHFLKDTPFIELKIVHDLEMVFGLHQNVNLVLVNPR